MILVVVYPLYLVHEVLQVGIERQGCMGRGSPSELEETAPPATPAGAHPDPPAL
jgi:hypothetical protein